MEMANNQQLKIKDLGLAAALVALGFETDRDAFENGYVSFVFATSPTLEKAIDDYWANRLHVQARSHFDAIKMLKNRIYGQRHRYAA